MTEAAHSALRSLPANIARSIDPAVWAARAARIGERERDVLNERVRLQRCAEIIADDLLKGVS